MSPKQRILSGSDAARAAAWAFAPMDVPAAPEPGVATAAPDAPDPAVIEELQRRAYDAAYAAGLAEGRAAGQRELALKVQQLDCLLGALAHPFEALDDSVERELVTLVMTLVRQLLRRELRAEPGEVVAVVREALALLPVAARNVSVHLHPNDAALVRESLAGSGEERPWRLVEDPLLGRGGCRVTTEDSHIDASIETRLTKLFAQVFGDERVRDGVGVR